MHNNIETGFYKRSNVIFYGFSLLDMYNGRVALRAIKVNDFCFVNISRYLITYMLLFLSVLDAYKQLYYTEHHKLYIN